MRSDGLAVLGFSFFQVGFALTFAMALPSKGFHFDYSLPSCGIVGTFFFLGSVCAFRTAGWIAGAFFWAAVTAALVAFAQIMCVHMHVYG
jgi:hypothetical protein